MARGERRCVFGVVFGTVFDMTKQPETHDSPDIPAHLWAEWENYERNLWLNSDEPWWLDTITYEEWLDYIAKKYLTPNAYAEWRRERTEWLAMKADDDAYRSRVAWGIA